MPSLASPYVSHGQYRLSSHDLAGQGGSQRREVSLQLGLVAQGGQMGVIGLVADALHDWRSPPATEY